MAQKRYFVRLKTRQQARLLLAEGQAYQCEIHDFCPTGLLLKLPDPKVVVGAGKALTQSQAVVVFKGGSKEFQVRGRIAHCSGGVLGIFAEDMPTTAFRVLLQYRTLLYQKELPSGGAKLDPVDGQTIKSQCLSLYRPFISRVAGEFFHLADKRGQALEEYQVAVDLGERTSSLAACAVIARQRQHIEHAFGLVALAKVEGNHHHPQAPAEEDAAEAKLSLVREDEFEDWLNLATVINQLEIGLKRYLSYFESMYNVLTGTPPEQDLETGYFHSSMSQGSPFSPDALCRSLQEALQGLELDIAQRARLYQLFGQAVSLHGEALYESLSMLASVIESRPGRTGSTRPPEPSLRGSGGGQGFSPPGGEAGAPPPDEQAMGTAAVPAEPNREPASHGPDGNSLIHTTSMLRQMVSQLIPLLPSQAAARAASPPGETRPALPAAETGEILQALNQVIQARRGGATVTAGQAPLSEQLHSRLGQEGGTGVTLSPQHAQVLDSVGTVFDHARQEHTAESELELLLRRFELPFYKLALEDPVFLGAEQHPARQAINLLDQFAIATDDSGKFIDSRLRNSLEALVDEAISKAEQSADIYQQMVLVLEKMLQPLRSERSQRVQRLQEASEGKHRILSSRARVLSELEARLGGRDVPRILLRLLSSGWQHHLGLLALRLGTQGADWEEAIGVVDLLFAWLDPDFTPTPDHPEQVKELLRRLKWGLAALCLAPDDATALQTELAALLQPDRHEQPPPERVALAPGWLLRGQEEMTPNFHRDNPLCEQLLLGCWWNIAGDDGTAAIPMQLIWLSQPPGFCTFANRSAHRKLELTLADLAGRKAAGRADTAPDMELPLLARSESAMVNGIFRQLAHQATHDPVTDLLNRRALLHQLGQMAARPGRDLPHVLWAISFDKIHTIAERYGTESRKAMLCQLAEMVRQGLRPDDLLAALEDGFAVCLPACDAAEGQRRATNLVAGIQAYRWQHGQERIGVGAAVGMVEFRPGCLEAEEILHRAETVCRQALAAGPYQVLWYTADDAASNVQEALAQLTERIDRLPDRKGLFLRCQRISPIQHRPGQRPYYEILLGVRAPDGSELGPQGFIRAVERSNRTQDIDRWVVDKVCHWMLAHPDIMNTIGGFSINLSSRSLDNEGLLDFLHQVLATPQLPASKIMFEISEPDTINSTVAISNFIQQFRRFGCKFCIDDFGSGYASYGNLKSLSATAFKIDGNFIRGMLQNPTDYAMVQSTTEIGHSLGMRVIAEQVETPALLDAVREIGVDYVQGNAEHTPTPLDELPAISVDKDKSSCN
ncbi:MAG: hypothetical protein BWK76_06125 [Desulfobulbaceae bacterium A2]|nr:MAG: hypothetical protein BWK76_06125 [Desulfobulbaceae bacterium A2]